MVLQRMAQRPQQYTARGRIVSCDSNRVLVVARVFRESAARVRAEAKQFAVSREYVPARPDRATGGMRHARSTNRSSTRFSPALSNAIASRSFSAACTVP